MKLVSSPSGFQERGLSGACSSQAGPVLLRVREACRRALFVLGRGTHGELMSSATRSDGVSVQRLSQHVSVKSGSELN